MIRIIVKIILWLLLAILAIFTFVVVRYWDTVQRVFLGGKHVYETTSPVLPADLKRPAVLVFSKTNAFRHEEAIPAANAMFEKMARAKGWGYFQTENSAAFTPAMLARFNTVVFNNVSGDVFSRDQQTAFKSFIENGGGYVGIHAAGDSSHKGWSWYINDVIGTLFTQHTMNPQFQPATVHVENPNHSVVQGLPASWIRTDEWYSFDKSPRAGGATVLLTVDEKTYNPEGIFWKDLRMGDHPVAWSRCIGKGRIFYTAFGHRAETFAEPETRTLLANATAWSMGEDGTDCGAPEAQSAEGKTR